MTRSGKSTPLRGFFHGREQVYPSYEVKKKLRHKRYSSYRDDCPPSEDEIIVDNLIILFRLLLWSWFNRNASDFWIYVAKDWGLQIPADTVQTIVRYHQDCRLAWSSRYQDFHRYPRSFHNAPEEPINSRERLLVHLVDRVQELQSGMGNVVPCVTPDNPATYRQRWGVILDEHLHALFNENVKEHLDNLFKPTVEGFRGRFRTPQQPADWRMATVSPSVFALSELQYAPSSPTRYTRYVGGTETYNAAALQLRQTASDRPRHTAQDSVIQVKEEEEHGEGHRSKVEAGDENESAEGSEDEQPGGQDTGTVLDPYDIPDSPAQKITRPSKSAHSSKSGSATAAPLAKRKDKPTPANKDTDSDNEKAAKREKKARKKATKQKQLQVDDESVKAEESDDKGDLGQKIVPLLCEEPNHGASEIDNARGALGNLVEAFEKTGQAISQIEEVSQTLAGINLPWDERVRQAGEQASEAATGDARCHDAVDDRLHLIERRLATVELGNDTLRRHNAAMATTIDSSQATLRPLLLAVSEAVGQMGSGVQELMLVVTGNLANEARKAEQAGEEQEHDSPAILGALQSEIANEEHEEHEEHEVEDKKKEGKKKKKRKLAAEPAVEEHQVEEDDRPKKKSKMKSKKAE